MENSLLDSLKGSVYYSIMADESTDVASEEELSVYIYELRALVRNGSAVVEFIAFVEFIYFIHVLTSQRVCINICAIRHVR